MAQATRKKPQQARITFKFQRGLREAVMWVCVALALYLILALLTYNPSDPGWLQTAPAGRHSNVAGVVGAYFTDITFHFFGYLGFLLPVLVVYGGWLFYRCTSDEGTSANTFHPANLALGIIGLLITFAAGAGIVTLQAVKPWWCAAPVYLGVKSCGAGGVLGELVGVKLVWTLGYGGASVFLLGLLFAGVTLFTGISWAGLAEWIGRLTCRLVDGWEKYLHQAASWATEVNKHREARRAGETLADEDHPSPRAGEVRIEPFLGDLKGGLDLSLVPETPAKPVTPPVSSPTVNPPEKSAGTVSPPQSGPNVLTSHEDNAATTETHLQPLPVATLLERSAAPAPPPTITPPPRPVITATPPSALMPPRDQGLGFDWRNYLEISPERAFDTHGRGIAMSKRLSFDRLEYHGCGNEVLAAVAV